MKISIDKLLVIILPLLAIVLSACASTKGYYGRSEENVAVISSQKHSVTVGKKSSWEIAYLCKVDDKVVGNNFRGFPSKCKVLPGRRTIEVEHHQQWKDNSSGLVVAGAMFGAIGGAIAGAGVMAVGIFTGGSGWMALAGAGAGAMTALNNGIISQTGKNFDGFRSIVWDPIWKNVLSGAAAGAVTSLCGQALAVYNPYI